MLPSSFNSKYFQSILLLCLEYWEKPSRIWDGSQTIFRSVEFYVLYQLVAGAGAGQRAGGRRRAAGRWPVAGVSSDSSRTETTSYLNKYKNDIT